MTNVAVDARWSRARSHRPCCASRPSRPGRLGEIDSGGHFGRPGRRIHRGSSFPLRRSVQLILGNRAGFSVRRAPLRQCRFHLAAEFKIALALAVQNIRHRFPLGGAEDAKNVGHARRVRHEVAESREGRWEGEHILVDRLLHSTRFPPHVGPTAGDSHLGKAAEFRYSSAGRGAAALRKRSATASPSPDSVGGEARISVAPSASARRSAE